MRTDKFLKLAFPDNDGAKDRLPKKIATASTTSLTLTQIWKYVAEPNGIDVVDAVVAIVERRCRICGCIESNCLQCIEKTGDACRWVADDLCSACVPPKKRKSGNSNRGTGSRTRSSRKNKSARQGKSRLALLLKSS